MAGTARHVISRPTMADTQLTGQQLYARQLALRARGILPGPIVVACGLVINDNIGGLLRVAEAAGCAEVIFVGDVDLERRAIKSAARGGDKLLATRSMSNDAFIALASTLPTLLALDLTHQARPLFGPGASPLPSPLTLLIGSEQHGIPDALLALCTGAVQIPMYGVNGSMNVIMACGIALFEWRRQQSVIDHA